jgi:hypothetical protein
MKTTTRNSRITSPSAVALAKAGHLRKGAWLQRSFTVSLLTVLAALGFLALLPPTAQATLPNPVVSSIFVPIEGDITEPGTTNLLHLTGEIHVLTQVTFSDAGVPSVGIWANLVRVRGTSSVTGITWLGVGAQNADWVGTNPGPPNIPEQQFSFTPVEVKPGPPLFRRVQFCQSSCATLSLASRIPTGESYRPSKPALVSD